MMFAAALSVWALSRLLQPHPSHLQPLCAAAAATRKRALYSSVAPFLDHPVLVYTCKQPAGWRASAYTLWLIQRRLQTDCSASLADDDLRRSHTPISRFCS